MKTIIGAQGEVTILKVDALPENIDTKAVARSAKGFVISHSESGHHHLLTGGEVLERTSDLPEGMQILYGILDERHALINDAPGAHGSFDLDRGIYEFRISREFDPFSEQARRVAD